MKSAKINFETFGTNEFGIINPTRKAHLGDTIEQTFKNCLNSLPKHISKGWETITFDFENETIEVVKQWLIETDWNFNSSVNITQKIQS